MNLWSKIKYQVPLNYWLVLFIFTISLIPRLIWLGQFPPGISQDELDYELTARSLYLTGSDVSQTWNPWSLTGARMKNTVAAELSPVFLALLNGWTTPSLFTARMPFVLIYSLLNCVWFLIMYEITKSRKTALICGLILAFNPWSLQLSHTLYEAAFSFLFYSLAIWLYLRQSSKLTNLIFANLCLILGFYSYHGAKIVFLPLSIGLTWFSYRYLKQPHKSLFFFLAFNFIILSFFIINLRSQPLSSRFNEVLTPFTPGISQQVNTDRLLSISSPLNILFTNKFTGFVYHFITNYLAALSLPKFFSSGESMLNASMDIHGYFYPFEILFFLLGIYYLCKSPGKIRNFFLMLLIIFPLSTAFYSKLPTIVLRSGLLIPFYIGIIAIGISNLITVIPKRSLKIGILCLYLLGVTNFLYLYFFRYPVYAARNNQFGDRILSSYLTRIRPISQHIYVFIHDRRALEEEYMFYNSQELTKDQILHYAGDLKQSIFNWDKINFIGSCRDILSLGPSSTIIIDANISCTGDDRVELPPGYPVQVADPKDSGAMYLIYNDQLCDKTKLNEYLGSDGFHLSAFQIESLSNSDFCTQWLTRKKSG